MEIHQVIALRVVAVALFVIAVVIVLTATTHALDWLIYR